MNIYIDESGIFSNPASNKVAVSCVSGLVIPEIQQERIFNEYENILKVWNTSGNELKGSSLDESQVATIIEILRKYDVLLEIVGIDLSMHKDSDITKHKELQADKLVANLTSKHSKESIENMKRLQGILKQLSNQLYIQSVLTFQLIQSVLNTSTLFYCQRYPKELSAFNWIVDAKEIKRISYEDYWSTTVAMYLQSMSIKQPLITYESGDYSFFKRFYSDEIPEYLKGIVVKEENNLILNATMILKESLIFSDSKSNYGLELIDILANSFCRAIKNNLQIIGWDKLGNLIVNKNKDTIKFVSLSTQSGERSVKVNYANVVEHITNNSKSLWKH